MTTAWDPPLPPFELRERVGAVTFPESPEHQRQVATAEWWDPDPAQAWLRQGQFLAGIVRDHLPQGFDLRGAHVLDFGCGAGRVMRHLVDDVGGDGEMCGVDIDRPSIEWLRANASPPLRPALCDERPWLPYPDGQFDLVYALSVFTHIVADWAGWLLELRRVLAPGGVLIATAIGRRTAAELGLEPPDDDAPGMYAYVLGNDWDSGGPVVVADRAWIAERWGRAFEIAVHAERATGEPWPHDLIVARPGGASVGEAALLAGGADESGEGASQAAALRIMRRDALVREHGYQVRVAAAVQAGRLARVELDARAAERAAELLRRRDALEGAGPRPERPRAISRAARALAPRRG
jgi:SAM-dependent methyltransferase